jgi:hypothetical protein
MEAVRQLPRGGREEFRGTARPAGHPSTSGARATHLGRARRQFPNVADWHFSDVPLRAIKVRSSGKNGRL